MLFSPSAQCPDANGPSKSAIHPHLEYCMTAYVRNLVADVSHLERVERLVTRLVTNFLYPLRREASPIVCGSTLHFPPLQVI